MLLTLELGVNLYGVGDSLQLLTLQLGVNQ